MIERKEIRENPTRKIPSRKIFRIKKTHREQVLTLPNFTRKESFVLARQILSKWINCSTVKLAVINGWRTVSFFSRERVPLSSIEMFRWGPIVANDRREEKKTEVEWTVYFSSRVKYRVRWWSPSLAFSRPTYI